MKTRSLFIALTLVVFLGAQLAFGWGNATHVYFAKHLGAQIGPFNMNEMYGALLPDCFNVVMTEPGQYLAGLTHVADLSSGPVWTVAKTPLQKSLALGFLTHYQAWGADHTAHVDYDPFNADPPGGPIGYIIGKSYEFMPQVLEVLNNEILVPPIGVPEDAFTEFSRGLAAALAHDLLETAVDILVRKNIEPAVGVEMMLAAKRRPSNAGQLLADAYAENLATTFAMPMKEARGIIIGAEKEYQEYIKQYGRLFSLPADQIIPLLSMQTAPIAEMYIEGIFAQYFETFTMDVIVTPEQVAPLLIAALAKLETEGDYDEELALTLTFVQSGLDAHGILSPHRMFAHDASEEFVELDDFTTMPTTYALAQNTPNPFNPSTVIGFSLPDQAHVRLTVYNALGQEVARLVDEERPAGSYAAQWNAVNQPSGAYFYRIEAGSFVETRRMMLVK